MVQFPDRSYYQGPSLPGRFEIDIRDLETEGDIPAQLDGTFYRVAPDPQFPPRAGKDIYFNGDGVVSMFRFDKGRIDLKHRYVRTDKWKLERDAGRALFGVYRTPATDDPSVKGRYRGTANTNVLYHGGRLFALKEDSPPVAMDPLTLETKGYWDFGGKLKSETFTAHPKIDHETGEMIALSYATGGIATPTMALHTIDKNGRIVHDVRFEAPYYCMVHDYGMTRDYVVFHIVPMTGSLTRTNPEAPHFGFDKTLDVYVGVIPRRGEARDLRWFKGPNQFCSHVMNAFNDGAKVHLDVPVAEGNMFPFFPDIDGTPFNPARAQSRITRWTMDLAKNSDAFSAQQLTDFVGEMPRIDDRYAGHPYRHGWLLDFGIGPAGVPKLALGHLDHAKGTSKRWEDPAYTLQEPAFIPKSKDAAEGEGYIVQLGGKMQERRSDLLIFDAQHIDQGPIGKAKLPVFLRGGLHGNWHTMEEMRAAA